MRILVTGGAGFIGSHTADRLIAEGHEVAIVDALRAPVHRDEKPLYLPPGAAFHKGDVRDRALMTRLLKEADAVYHFAAYQDYLTDFSTFFDINVTATALLFEILLAQGLKPKRVIVASSQAVMGEGLYRCPEHGERHPGLRSEERLKRGEWDILCPDCGRRLEWQRTPESFANPQNPYGMSKFAQEMVALNLGKRLDVPTVALRYSIVQGPRQSVYNAYSGACRVFSLSYKLGVPPAIYEDGRSLRDYVNIDDVVDANLLALKDERAAGRVFNVGGGRPYTVLEFAEIVRKAYRSTLRPKIGGEYRVGDTRHIVSDITALMALGWRPRRSAEDSVAAYARWLDGLKGLEGILEEASAKMRAAGVVRSARR